MLCPECKQAGCEDKSCIGYVEIYLFDGKGNCIASKEFEYKKSDPFTDKELQELAKKFRDEYIKNIVYEIHN